jgi:hypothetical protein
MIGHCSATWLLEVRGAAELSQAGDCDRWRQVSFQVITESQCRNPLASLFQSNARFAFSWWVTQAFSKAQSQISAQQDEWPLFRVSLPVLFFHTLCSTYRLSVSIFISFSGRQHPEHPDCLTNSDQRAIPN